MTKRSSNTTDRRNFLSGCAAILGTAMVPRLAAQASAALEIASAGSVKGMLDGPFKTAVAKSLGLELHSHSQGADAVAKALVEGSLHADVFLPITAAPMRTVLEAGKASHVQAFARTEMVLMYSPKSRLASQLEADPANWWKTLQRPDLRLSRSDPSGDPSGRNILFVMMLAAKKYKQPDLVEKVLGPVMNAQQVGGGNSIERLQSGELDCAVSYKTAPGFSGLHFISLPADVNLSGDDVHAKHPDISLTLNGKTFVPEPLIFFSAVLKDATNPQGAARFVEWLQTPEAQGLLRAHQFDAVAVDDTPFQKKNTAGE